MGVIRPEELYTLAAFKTQLGVKDATLRKARRAGLPVYSVYKRSYVFGRDWIEHVIQHGTKTGGASNATS